MIVCFFFFLLFITSATIIEGMTEQQYYTLMPIYTHTAHIRNNNNDIISETTPLYNCNEAYDLMKELFDNNRYGEVISIYQNTIKKLPANIKYVPQQLKRSFLKSNDLIQAIAKTCDDRAISLIATDETREIKLSSINFDDEAHERLVSAYDFFNFVRKYNVTNHMKKLINEFLLDNKKYFAECNALDTHDPLRNNIIIKEMLERFNRGTFPSQTVLRDTDNDFLNAIAQSYTVAGQYEAAEQYWITSIERYGNKCTTTFFESAAIARTKSNKLLREEDIQYIMNYYPTIYTYLIQQQPIRWKQSFNIALILQKSLSMLEKKHNGKMCATQEYKDICEAIITHLTYAAQFPQYWSQSYQTNINEDLAQTYTKLITHYAYKNNFSRMLDCYLNALYYHAQLQVIDDTNVTEQYAQLINLLIDDKTRTPDFYATHALEILSVVNVIFNKYNIPINTHNKPLYTEQFACSLLCKNVLLPALTLQDDMGNKGAQLIRAKLYFAKKEWNELLHFENSSSNPFLQGLACVARIACSQDTGVIQKAFDHIINFFDIYTAHTYSEIPLIAHAIIEPCVKYVRESKNYALVSKLVQQLCAAESTKKCAISLLYALHIQLSNEEQKQWASHISSSGIYEAIIKNSNAYYDSSVYSMLAHIVNGKFNYTLDSMRHYKTYARDLFIKALDTCLDTTTKSFLEADIKRLDAILTLLSTEADTTFSRTALLSLISHNAQEASASLQNELPLLLALIYEHLHDYDKANIYFTQLINDTHYKVTKKIRQSAAYARMRISTIIGSNDIDYILTLHPKICNELIGQGNTYSFNAALLLKAHIAMLPVTAQGYNEICYSAITHLTDIAEHNVHNIDSHILHAHLHDLHTYALRYYTHMNDIARMLHHFIYATYYAHMLTDKMQHKKLIEFIVHNKKGNNDFYNSHASIIFPILKFILTPQDSSADIWRIIQKIKAPFASSQLCTKLLTYIEQVDPAFSHDAHALIAAIYCAKQEWRKAHEYLVHYENFLQGNNQHNQGQFFKRLATIAYIKVAPPFNAILHAIIFFDRENRDSVSNDKMFYVTARAIFNDCIQYIQNTQFYDEGALLIEQLLKFENTRKTGIEMLYKVQEGLQESEKDVWANQIDYLFSQLAHTNFDYNGSTCSMIAYLFGKRIVNTYEEALYNQNQAILYYTQALKCTKQNKQTPILHDLQKAYYGLTQLHKTLGNTTEYNHFLNIAADLGSIPAQIEQNMLIIRNSKSTKQAIINAIAFLEKHYSHSVLAPQLLAGLYITANRKEGMHHITLDIIKPNLTKAIFYFEKSATMQDNEALFSLFQIHYHTNQLTNITESERKKFFDIRKAAKYIGQYANTCEQNSKKAFDNFVRAGMTNYEAKLYDESKNCFNKAKQITDTTDINRKLSPIIHIHLAALECKEKEPNNAAIRDHLIHGFKPIHTLLLDHTNQTEFYKCVKALLCDHSVLDILAQQCIKIQKNKNIDHRLTLELSLYVLRLLDVSLETPCHKTIIESVNNYSRIIINYIKSWADKRDPQALKVISAFYQTKLTRNKAEDLLYYVQKWTSLNLNHTEYESEIESLIYICNHPERGPLYRYFLLYNYYKNNNEYVENLLKTMNCQQNCSSVLHIKNVNVDNILPSPTLLEKYANDYCNNPTNEPYWKCNAALLLGTAKSYSFSKLVLMEGVGYLQTIFDQKILLKIEERKEKKNSYDPFSQELLSIVDLHTILEKSYLKLSNMEDMKQAQELYHKRIVLNGDACKKIMSEKMLNEKQDNSRT